MSHGTSSGYKGGCRCDDCKGYKRAADRRSYQRNAEKRKSAAKARRLADPEADKRRKRDYYVRNKEQVLAKNAEYRKANPDKFRQYSAEWVKRNPDRRRGQARASDASTRDRQRAWREANADHLKAYKRAYYQQNRSTILESVLERQRENPEPARLNAKRRRARLAEATIVHFTVEQLRQRLSMFSGCWICGDVATEVDHVKPLKAGGAHCLANLRPICQPCNRAKSARWPFDPVAFLQERNVA